jgi:hypothetical protein
MSNLAVIKQGQSDSLQVRSMDDLARLAKMFADSGYFSDCQSAAQAGVKIAAGLEVGIGAFASLSGIHLIKGKPAIGANIMAAMIKRSGKYNYRVLEHTDSICRIAFFEGKEEIGVSEFSAADAAKLGTQNMNKFPKNMLFARCISNGVKWHCPDLFLGVPVYTPDELGASDDLDSITVPIEHVKPVKASVTVVGVEVDLLPRLNWLMDCTGKTEAQIRAIAAKQKPPIDIESVGGISFEVLRNAVYASWGADQGVFKAPKHAWNAFQEVYASVGADATDKELWMAWDAEISDRIAAKQPPNTEGIIQDDKAEDF